MKPVLVTTLHRGVFFGYLESEDMPKSLPNSITLKKLRNCLTWKSAVKGFIGLAVNGPTKDCKIGPAIEEMVLYDVTSIGNVTEKAAQKWEDAPWGADPWS